MQPQEYLDRLSTHLKNTIARAIGTATAMAHTEVSPLHLIFALSEEPGAVGNEILTKLNIDKESIQKVLDAFALAEDIDPKKNLTTVLPELNTLSKKALEKAMLLAYEHEHNYIGTEHLLFGIVHIDDIAVQTLLKDVTLSTEAMIEEISVILESTNKFPDMEEIAETIEEMQNMIEEDDIPKPLPNPIPKSKKKNKKKKQSAVEVFTLELTGKERQKKIDPVIGRTTEVERMIHILSRRTKNNPVLVGEPGVGKTAIVEGLAKRIVEKDVPDVLRNKRIYALDLPLLISGTIYRGEFESRIKQIIDEFSKNDNAILFIDEIHNIIGAGSNQGTMDAANILKPALARGDLHCIGATTLDEYQKYIITDPALARRFQSITVKEPTNEETITILTGLAKYYEAFHNVTIKTDAIEAAVHLSTKYIHDNFLPDKAIDLLDEAAAAVKVARNISDEQKAYTEQLERVSKLASDKELAISEERYDDAMALKEEVEHIETALKTLKKESEKSKKLETKTPVTAIHVARVLAARIDEPAERLLEDEWTKLGTLTADLKKHIIGQDTVLETITETLKKGYLNLQENKRPIASLLFTGPSGTGKTALSKALATTLYSSKDSLVRLDMTEFAEAHGVSKLLGSPAGYVGYNERNKFLEQIRTRPYSVVLFDEFDKAHPDVRKLLLQILDEGFLTDSTGRKISFAHAIIILTANIGAEKFTSLGIGFDKSTSGSSSVTKAIESELNEQFGSTLLSRVDSTCIFTPLKKSDVKKIIKKHTNKLLTTLKSSRDISLNIETGVIDKLYTDAFSKKHGIRQMERKIDTIVQNLVIEKLSMKRRKKAYTLTTDNTTYKLV